MKGTQHLAVHSFLLFLLVLGIIFVGKIDIINILSGETFLIIIIGVGFCFLGAILPDADSNSKGSYIYYKKGLYFLAHLVSWLEHPIAKLITKRPIRHRESLHTIIGIAITSLFVIILISVIYQYIFKNISLSYIIFWYFSLFIGQFFHLLEDTIEYPHLKINWK